MANSAPKKGHPWRVCPSGQYWVGTSTSFPRGKAKVTPKCSKIRGSKEKILWFELQFIAKKYFSKRTGPPKADNLGFGKKGNQFDSLIRGWTKFWNEVFEPKDPLDPNLVKALIGSESNFDIEPITDGDACGLMQIRERTRGILGRQRAELRNYLIDIPKTGSVLLDPAVNIGAGVRWLFRKREIASSKLKRQATWEEAVAEYKSYFRQYLKNPDYRGMRRFRELYARIMK
jgi:hypothetical protein